MIVTSNEPYLFIDANTAALCTVLVDCVVCASEAPSPVRTMPEEGEGLAFLVICMVLTAGNISCFVTEIQIIP